VNSLGCEEDVGRFDVAVDNIALVTVGERLEQLKYDHYRMQWCQLNTDGLNHSSDVVLSILKRHEILACNINVIVLG